MKTVAFIISWVITQLTLAGICHLAYYLLLKNLIIKDISFLNWLGIIVIASCIIPSGRIIKPGVDSNKPKEGGLNSIMEKYTNGR
jgi:hypothetical protein